MKTMARLVMIGASMAMLASPGVVLAQFACTTNADRTITIVKYTGEEGSLSIPGTIDDLPVVSIGNYAFSGTGLTSVTIPNGVTAIGVQAFGFCTNLTRVTISKSVASLGYGAFYNCVNLTRVYFKGNSPNLGSCVFDNDEKATIYYLSGTTGWGATCGGRPAEVWNQ